MLSKSAARRSTACVLLFLCAVAGFGQQTGKRRAGGAKPAAAVTPKSELQGAIAKTLKAKSLRVVAAVTVQNKEIYSVFEYAAPDRLRLVERAGGEIKKEIVEIANQMFRKEGGKWIKMRMDGYLITLKKQLDTQIPIKLSSKKGDFIVVKNAEVVSDGETVINEKPHRKYDYRIAYHDFDQIDTGTIWVDASSGRVRRLASAGVGVFGPFSSVWDYYYDEEIKIATPSDFVTEK